MFSTIHEAEAFFNRRRNIGIKPGLERIQELLDRLGNPEKALTTIHIAGTNGKGSTLHFLNAALRANEVHTGIFTSPSFTGLTGHIIFNDQEIEEAEFINVLNRIYPSIIEMDENNHAPTEFEILTAIAFVFFSKNGEIILIETGMGGRFDTTNVIHPLLSIITNIAIDHTAYLGETHEEIAYHKAGIIKAHVPVVIGNVKNSALQVIKKEAIRNKSDYFILGEDFHVYSQLPAALNMKGAHQYKNVSLAIKALEILAGMGYKINWAQALKGIVHTQAPGRFELIHRKPVIIADAAHNPDGIRTLIDTANKHYPDREKHVITAIFKDKQLEEMLRELSENFTSVTLTSFKHPRAASTEELQGEVNRKGMKVKKDWQELMSQILKQEDKLFFITGSMHFITLVREYLLKKGHFL